MADTPVSPAPMPAQLARWTPQPLPVQAPEDPVGKLFGGRYRMGRKIGGGGMSTIHEARDMVLGARCVVKIMRSDLPPDPVDRFRREAHVLATLSHEHLARILDRHDPDDGPRFLVTEYIDGIDLGHLRRRKALPAAVVHQLALQVSSALAYAHTAGVLHRDINPANLMLVRHPSGDVFAKVIDFGIAKLLQGSELAAPENAPPGARRETRGDVVLGTPPYYRGHEGPWRDVYALALTLSELLTGEAPDPDVDLEEKRVPSALAQAIMSALRSACTMDEFHAALREANVQREVDAEAERRRYVARAFSGDQPGSKPAPVEYVRFATRYIIAGELGHGGMGRVRIAFDTENRRKVALKTINPRCAGWKNLEHRFRREARALAAIEHRGAPALYDSDTLPEPYFTMEIVEGISLAATLRHGKIEPIRALGMAIELGEILHAAHEVGVIHRDVKPDNILIGHGDHVRLIDFGACMLMPRFHQRHLLFPATPPDERYETGELETVGTPGYTAPEILDLSGGTGPRSDVYSLCAVLYEMLSGRRLVDRPMGRATAIERGEFPASLGPVADLLRRNTSREPTDRMWTMSEVVRSLEILRTDLRRARERRSILLGTAVASLVLTSVALLLAFLVFAPTVPPTATANGSLPISTAEPSPAVHVSPAANAAPPVSPPKSTPAPVPSSSPSAPTVLKPNPEPPRSSANPSAPTHDPSASLDVAPPMTAPRPRRTKAEPEFITEAMVAKRVTRRHARLREECGEKLLILDLEIKDGHARLTAANGMPFAASNRLHTCIREQLLGLTFPDLDQPATFTLALDLKDPP